MDAILANGCQKRHGILFSQHSIFIAKIPDPHLLGAEKAFTLP
jgi:hypothetical protein